MVRHVVPRADGGPGPGLAGHRRRPAHPHLRAHRLAARPWRPSCGASTSSSRRRRPSKERRTRLLYLSPLRALAFDVEKNLRAPLAGIRLAAERLGLPFTEPTVGLRTGDTCARERQALVRHPPDLLITTPESLYLMLTSNARETLPGVEAVIVDEIHALAPTKRGAHLALTLERLDALCEPAAPAHRAVGHAAPAGGGRPLPRRLRGARPARPVTIVDAGVRKPLEVEVVVPVEDMGDLGQVATEPAQRPGRAAGAGRKSIWPSIYPRILELVLAHRSTIIFCNARRLAERLAARLNELAETEGVDVGEAAASWSRPTTARWPASSASSSRTS